MAGLACVVLQTRAIRACANPVTQENDANAVGLYTQLKGVITKNYTFFYGMISDSYLTVMSISTKLILTIDHS